jgi:hypothetical protein
MTTRFDAAQRQLATAIELFFEGRWRQSVTQPSPSFIQKRDRNSDR